MNNKFIELLLTIESLSPEELEKLSAWIDFVLNKKCDPSNNLESTP